MSIQQAYTKQVASALPGSQASQVIASIIGAWGSTDLAYLAGFFDGEGYVGIRINKRNGCEFKTLHVSIGQAHEGIVKKLQEWYGGSIHTYEPREGRKITKHFYQWSIVGLRALRFLHDIYPYVIVKKEQIDRAVEAKYEW